MARRKHSQNKPFNNPKIASNNRRNCEREYKKIADLEFERNNKVHS